MPVWKKLKARARPKAKARKTKGTKGFGRQNAWIRASMQARKELGIEGFRAIKRGTSLYSRAKAIHSNIQN